MNRRELLATAAAGFLLRPALAAAATDGDAEVLIRLIHLEEEAALGYDVDVDGVGGRFGADEEAHARALRTELQALGREAGPGSEPSGAARRLAAARPGDRVSAAIALEGSLMAAYRAALLELQEPAILQTAGSILAGHAQHRALLLRRAGRSPLGE